MIKTKKEYQDALSAVKILETETIREDAERLRLAGLASRTIGLLVGASHARIAQLRDQIQLYERVRSGDLSAFEGPEEFGRLLIGGRIAKGWSQRELAERLGVHESQVSRDERNEYAGITLERWRLLCQTLEIDVRAQARVAAFDKAPDVIDPLQGGELASLGTDVSRRMPSLPTTPQPLRMSASLNPSEWLRGLAHGLAHNLGKVMEVAAGSFLNPNSGPTGPTGPTGISYPQLGATI